MILVFLQEERKDIIENIWIYIYLTNCGYIITTLIFVSSSIVFVIFLIFQVLITLVGFCIILCKYRNEICSNFSERYFNADYLKRLWVLPFKYVWTFIRKTNDCCQPQTYVVGVKNNGELKEVDTAESCWCKILKRFIMLVATIDYYVFMIGLSIFIGIGILCVKYCCKKPQENQVTSNQIETQNDPLINKEGNNLNIGTPMQQNNNAVELKVNNYGQQTEQEQIDNNYNQNNNENYNNNYNNVNYNNNPGVNYNNYNNIDYNQNSNQNNTNIDYNQNNNNFNNNIDYNQNNNNNYVPNQNDIPLSDVPTNNAY